MMQNTPKRFNYFPLGRGRRFNSHKVLTLFISNSICVLNTFYKFPMCSHDNKLCRWAKGKHFYNYILQVQNSIWGSVQSFRINFVMGQSKWLILNTEQGLWGCNPQLVNNRTNNRYQMYIKLPVDNSWLKACAIEGWTAEILHVVYLIIHIVIAHILSWHDTWDTRLKTS
jgi:hypothetical protein